MRAFIAAIAIVCAGVLVASGTNAQDKKDEKPKEVVLKGKITCAKCDLGTATECQTVIVVKDKETKKDITYYFDKAGHGKFHDDICSSAKNGSVTGTVKDAEKKKVVTVKKVEYDK
jgi:Family of unknown function (DUF6370)